MEQQSIYMVNLLKTQGNGDFACIKCGSMLSPDDETEKVYSILETVMNGNQLDEVIIKCQKCQTTIRLTGFSALGFA
jgi:transcription initiation factor IIE alpha subunit